jgi:hypothetical protein
MLGTWTYGFAKAKITPKASMIGIAVKNRTKHLELSRLPSPPSESALGDLREAISDATFFVFFSQHKR